MNRPFLHDISNIPVCRAVKVHVELLTFKHKSPGSDKSTWEEAIVGVNNYTCVFPATVTPCQNVCCLKGILHLHMPQSENKYV